MPEVTELLRGSGHGLWRQKNLGLNSDSVPYPLSQTLSFSLLVCKMGMGESSLLKTLWAK